MVLKRIFLILILPIFTYAQWTDPRPRSVQLWHMAEGVIDSLTVSAFYPDTLEAKETTLSEDVGGLIRINGFTSSSNYGAGLFLITNTSYTPDGANVIDLNSGSNQLVRITEPIVEDTLKLKNLPPLWQTVNLKQLSSSNTNGGGMFVYADSVSASANYGAISVKDGVSFKSSVAGKRWLRESYPLNRVVNAAWFGVTGDNSTDNTAAFNSLAALGDSAHIFVPTAEGFYVTGNIAINKTGQHWVFDKKAKIKVKNSTNDHLFEITKPGFTIEGGYFDGNSENNTSGSVIYINHTSTTDSVHNINIFNCKIVNAEERAIFGYGGVTGKRLENVTVRNVFIDSTSSSHGIQFNWNHKNILIEKVAIYRPNSNGIWIGNDFTDVTIRDVSVYDGNRMGAEFWVGGRNLTIENFKSKLKNLAFPQQGLSLDSVKSYNISTCDFDNTGFYGIELVRADSGNVNNVVISNTTNGISVNNSDYVVLNNIQIHNTDLDGIKLSNNPNHIDISHSKFSNLGGIPLNIQPTGTIYGLGFTHNEIVNCDSSIVTYINGTIYYPDISHNKVIFNALTPYNVFAFGFFRQGQINHNTIVDSTDSSTSSAIRVFQSQDIIFMGNIIKGFNGSGGKGIDITATSTRAIVMGNIINAATAITVAASDSIVVNNLTY